MAGFEHTISQPADKFKFMTAQIYIEVFIGMQMTGEQLKNAIESSKAKLQEIYPRKSTVPFIMLTAQTLEIIVKENMCDQNVLFQTFGEITKMAPAC